MCVGDIGCAIILASVVVFSDIVLILMARSSVKDYRQRRG